MWFIFYSSYLAWGQLGNLVPNSGFESGQNGQTPTSNCFTGGSCDVDNFDSRIEKWRVALFNPGCLASCLACTWATPDWIDIIQCSDFRYKPPSPFSNRFVGLYRGSKKKWTEGIRVTLNKKLRTGTKYLLRLKMAVSKITVSSGCTLRVHLTKFDTHWETDPKTSSNIQMLDVVNFIIPSNSPHKWYNQEIVFSIDSDKDNVLENLILMIHYNQQDGDYMFIDDVELYEYCPEEILIENRKYNYAELPLEAGVIKAGYDVGAPTTNGDVVVQNGSDVTYKAEQQIVLKPGFSVSYGGKFHAYIAACESECPAPVANAGENISVCDGNCRTIGGPPRYQTTYSWISEPLNAIDYLSDPFSPNPEFCPPPGYGTVIYTLRARNQCGDVATSRVVINYDNNPNHNPTLAVSNIQFGDFISFDVTVGGQTEEIMIQVCNTANTNCKKYTLKRVFDFTTNIFRWQIPEYLNVCDDYVVTVSSRNYCSPNLAVSTINWNRDRVIRIKKLPNVFFTSSGPYCAEVTGAEHYNLMVFNRNGNSLIFRGGGAIAGVNPVCMWNGTCNFANPACKPGEKVVDGVYKFLVEFSNGCYTTQRAQYFVHIYNYRPQMKKEEIPVPPTDSSGIISSITISPNPNEGRFTVFLADINQTAEVFDALGSRVPYPQKQNEAVLDFDISNLPKGIYFVKITDTSRQVTVKKVVYQ